MLAGSCTGRWRQFKTKFPRVVPCTVGRTHLRIFRSLTNRVFRMASDNSCDKSFVAAIDQGTSSTRVIIYNSLGESISTHQVPLNLITPHPGWVEQSPLEIMETVKECMKQAAAKAKEHGFAVSPESIKAIGLTNQRETTVVWDKLTGKPLYNTVGTASVDVFQTSTLHSLLLFMSDVLPPLSL